MQKKISRLTVLSATAALGLSAFAGAPAANAASAASAPVAAASHMAASPDLRVGDRGAAVSAWQQDINRVSGKIPGLAPVTRDGVYGPRTARATEQFQRYARIAVDGVVGPKTRAAMDTALHGSPSTPPALRPASSPLLRVGSRGAAVSTWQQDINRVSGKVPGLPTVTRDGVYGPRTAAATRDFQRFAKLAADGIVGARTWAAMDSTLHGAPSAG